MLSVKHIDEERLDRALTALANGTRRQIVLALGQQPYAINQLSEDLDVSLQAIHRHIELLEEARLVRRKKHGRVNFLALDRSGLRLTQDWLGQFHAYWGTEGETLENYIAAIVLRENKSKIKTRRRAG